MAAKREWDWQDYLTVKNNGIKPVIHWPVDHGDRCKCNECK